MSVRENLLRLHRWRLQERQEYLAGLESLLERLRNDAHRLEDEVAVADRAAGPEEGDRAEPTPFVQRLVERRRKIERSVTELESQIAAAQGAVDAALQEVKHAEGAVGPNAAGNLPLRVTRRTRPRRERPLRSRTAETRPRTV